MDRELATHVEDLPHPFKAPTTLEAAREGQVLCKTCKKGFEDALHRTEQPAEQARERAHFTMLETEKGS